jgi:hypothetical protein
MSEERQMRELDERQLSRLKEQLSDTLADFPPSVQGDVLFELLVERARSGHGYDLNSLIDMLTEVRDYGGHPDTWPKQA